MTAQSVLPTPSPERQIGQLNQKVGSIAYGFWRFAGTSVKEAREGGAR